MSDRKLVVKEKRRGCGYGSLIALCLVAIVIIGLWPRDRSLRPGGTSGLNPTPSSTALPKATPEGALAAKPTQTPEDKPEETYLPSKVTASEEIVLNRITQYGAISVRRAPGSVVNVVNLDSDLLQVESDGFSGEVKVDKTDFWERAIETRNVAMERLKRDEEVKKAPEEKQKADEARDATIQGFESADNFQIEIIQVLSEGCLATIIKWDSAIEPDPTGKRIFIEMTGSNLAEGQKYNVRAERSGTFSYTTALGASSTIERWIPIEEP
jgi:hypothetical protein